MSVCGCRTPYRKFGFQCRCVQFNKWLVAVVAVERAFARIAKCSSANFAHSNRSALTCAAHTLAHIQKERRSKYARTHKQQFHSIDCLNSYVHTIHNLFFLFAFYFWLSFCSLALFAFSVYSAYFCLRSVLSVLAAVSKLQTHARSSASNVFAFVRSNRSSDDG